MNSSPKKPKLPAEPASRPQIKPRNVRTRKEFATLINASWRKSVTAIIEAGRWLIEAKAELEHGEFQQMISDDLDFGFGSRSAEMLMKIAAHPVISNAKYVSHLPPSWGTLYEIASLPVDNETLVDWMQSDFIHNTITRAEVKKLGERKLPWSMKAEKAFGVLLELKREHRFLPEETAQKLHTMKPRGWSLAEQLPSLVEWLSELEAQFRTMQPERSDPFADEEDDEEEEVTPVGD
jgi:hypothetical protein